MKVKNCLMACLAPIEKLSQKLAGASHFGNLPKGLMGSSSVLLVLPFSFTAYSRRFSAKVSSDNRKPGIHVAWTTITYRSVALLILAGAAVFFIAVRVAFPQFTENSIKEADNVASKLLERVAGMAPPVGSGVSTSQQAHFTALDGTVRVKKGNGNSWVTADYNIPLEKGDVVQTGSEGMAKVVFNDGTNYTVKQDSLIVIEENSANDQQQTNVP